MKNKIMKTIIKNSKLIHSLYFLTCDFYLKGMNVTDDFDYKLNNISILTKIKISIN